MNKMWNNPKAAIPIIFATTLLVIGFLIYIWNSNYPEPSSPNQDSIRFTGTFTDTNQPKPYTFSVREEQKKQSEEIFSQDLGDADVLGSTIEAIGDAFSSVSFTSPEPPPPQYSLSPSFQITLTEQDVFEFGYTPYYRQRLSEINQIMIDVGFLKQGEIYKITNMGEAIAIQDKIADYFLYLSQRSTNGGHTPEQIEKYKKTYRETLPVLWREELAAKRAAARTSYLPAKIFHRYVEILAQKKIAMVMENIYTSLAINTANAQEVTSPDCYRHGAPDTFPGSQMAGFRCNDGYFCSQGCTYYSDCGPGSSSCNVPTGCLNLFCPGLPAIWDPLTTICGCSL